MFSIFEPAYTVSELFSALLHRSPTGWEEAYWGNELARNPLRRVLRRMCAYDEHQRFLNDRKLMFVPAGHFYSPIVDHDFVAARKENLRDQADPAPGIALNEQAQIDWVKNIKAVAGELPFGAEKIPGLRYHYENEAFKQGDALVYAAMLLKHRPKRIVEIGCGFSSALALDVCERVAGYEPEISFIDPFPELAAELLGGIDERRITIQKAFVQDIDPSTFEVLEDGDIYFMDTTHVVKTGSDVLYHFEKVLPRLKSGVIIHLHDIFYPFEYPESWIFDLKTSWNELYYFRAFMTLNPQFEIMFFNNFMDREHHDLMLDASPLFGKNGGCSIWFRKR